MSGPVFVDSNILVYARDPRDPSKQAAAARWLAQLWRDRSGRTSMQVLLEYYATLTRKLVPAVPADKAWDDVTELLAWRPHPVDAGLFKRGREVERRWRLSWWDSLIVAAAELQDCPVLLSEDLHDGMVFGSVTVRNPFTTVAEQPVAAYTVERAVPLHRPRGRPRRVLA